MILCLSNCEVIQTGENASLGKLCSELRVSYENRKQSDAKHTNICRVWHKVNTPINSKCTRSQRSMHVFWCQCSNCAFDCVNLFNPIGIKRSTINTTTIISEYATLPLVMIIAQRFSLISFIDLSSGLNLTTRRALQGMPQMQTSSPPRTGEADHLFLKVLQSYDQQELRQHWS